ncbi:MAG: hypothetical protein EHM45_05245 [Desulfobacteraceae bacterium]|nr:MAG: hypothetical protein EHM45_05245 [Desulfobacteraceae bacterium]
MATPNTPTTTDAGDFLKKSEKSLKNYAVRKYDFTSFLKSAMIAINDNTTLSECLRTEAGKKSLFNAMRYAATTGLSLNPQEGKAALIGYKNKAGEMVLNYQIMKNGLIDLALSSGKVEFVTADLVRANDEFSIKKSASGDDYSFSPAIRDRGEVIGFVAALKLKGSATYVKWMSTEEVAEFRDKYSSMYKNRPDASPWTHSFNGMGIKTVMKALLRSVSISPDVDAAVKSDDYIEAEFTVHGTTADDAVTQLQTPSKPVKAEEGQGELL